MGGALRNNFLANDWVLGLKARTGVQIADAYAAHIRSECISFLPQTELRKVAAADFGFELLLGNGQKERSEYFDALVIAAGTRHQGAEILRRVPGIDTLPKNTIVVGPHAFSEMQSYCGEDLLVIGAGDNAFEFGALAARNARSVTILARSQIKAQRRMRDRFASSVAVGSGEILEKADIVSVEIVGGRVCALVNSQEGQRRVYVDKIILQAGYVANTDLLLPLFEGNLRQRIRISPSGHIVVAPDQRTDCFAIYAVGDICNPLSPCVVTAVAAGAVAARSVESDFRDRK